MGMKAHPDSYVWSSRLECSNKDVDMLEVHIQRKGGAPPLYKSLPLQTGGKVPLGAWESRWATVRYLATPYINHLVVRHPAKIRLRGQACPETGLAACHPLRYIPTQAKPPPSDAR